MNKDIYTAAIIGVGRIGFSLMFDKLREQPASHTAAFLQNKRIKLTAACDTNADNLIAWHKVVRKAHVYTTLDEFIEKENCDIVTIAVNEDSHISVTKRILEKHPKLIILEKPVALNMAQGESLSAAAKKNGVPILINHERRNALDYKIAKDYIANIGEIETINARLDTSCYVYNPIKRDTGEYSLLHDGTHLLDAVLYMLESATGEAGVLNDRKITAIKRDSDNSDIVRYLNVHYRSSKCEDVNLIFSGSSRYFGFSLDIIGSEGRVTIGNGVFSIQKRAESKLYSGFYSLESDKSIKCPRKTCYFSNMIQNAVDFLDGDAPLQSNLDTGLNALALIEDIIADIEEK